MCFSTFSRSDSRGRVIEFVAPALQNMNFWSQLEYASAMRSVFPWALALFIVAALVLMMLRPLERMRIRAALLLFVLSLIGLLVVATLAVRGVPTDGRLYLWFDWATLFCLWIAFVNVASVLI